MHVFIKQMEISVETRITTVDVQYQKNEKQMVVDIKQSMLDLGYEEFPEEQLEKGDKVLVKNANMYGM